MSTVEEVQSLCNDASSALDAVDLRDQPNDLREYGRVLRRLIGVLQVAAGAARFRNIPSDLWGRVQGQLANLNAQVVASQATPGNLRANTEPTASQLIQSFAAFSALDQLPRADEVAARLAAFESGADVLIEKTREDLEPISAGLAEANAWLQSREDRWQAWRKNGLCTIWAARRRVESSARSIEELEADLRTRTAHLVTLIESATNAQTIDFFKEESKTQNESSHRYWWLGIGALAVATVFAVAPALANLAIWANSSDHHWLLHGRDSVAAHLAAAVAFGTVAAVLLRRSRRHEQTSQRARDLTVALSTMFAYSDQISEPGAQAAFLHEMGRVIIESYLRSPSHPAGDGMDGILSLVTRKT